MSWREVTWAVILDLLENELLGLLFLFCIPAWGIYLSFSVSKSSWAKRGSWSISTSVPLDEPFFLTPLPI